MIKKWQISLRSKHTVQVEHAAMSGLVMISVDNKEILRTTLPRGQDLDHQFSIEGKPCTLRIFYELKQYGNMASTETWQHDLLLDGVEQKVAPANPMPEKKWWEFWK